jgi:hypothetical protein
MEKVKEDPDERYPDRGMAASYHSKEGIEESFSFSLRQYPGKTEI